MTERSEPGIRLTLPPDLRHAGLVRSCLRDAVAFRTDDQASSFLVAVTEVMVNAIEASAATGRGGSARPDVVVEFWDGADARIEVHDAAGTAGRDLAKADHLGAGLSIAAAFVADLCIERSDAGTTVRLGLGDVLS